MHIEEESPKYYSSNKYLQKQTSLFILVLVKVFSDKVLG